MPQKIPQPFMEDVEVSTDGAKTLGYNILGVVVGVGTIVAGLKIFGSASEEAGVEDTDSPVDFN